MSLTPYQRAKLSRLRRVRGVPPMVDAAPVADHIRHLIGCHVPATAVADRANVGRSFVTRIARGEVKRLHADNAAALFAVDHRPHPSQNTVPAIGLTRRVHAAAAIGYSARDIADDIGMTSTGLSLLTAKPTCRYQRWADVATWYADHEHTRGTCNRARLWARRHGWAPPMAWDAETIDNPHAHAVTRPRGDTPVTGGDVDPHAVTRALAGSLPWRWLTVAERADAVTRMWINGNTDAAMAALVATRVDVITATRRAIGLPARTANRSKGA